MLKKLLEALRGGGASDKAPKQSAEAAEPIHYKGYEIIPMPDNSGGQYRVSALIRRSEEGHMQEQRFERSDMLPDRDSCLQLTRTKAERYIDEQGERLFNNLHHPS